MSDPGTCRQVHDGWELRFERRLRHAPEAVWAAITEPDGDGTLLTCTSTVRELPEAQFQGRSIGVPEVLTGWHSHLDALERSFDGGGWDQDLWDATLPRYRS